MHDVELRWTARLSWWTPVLLMIAVFLMGGGHGWYEPAIMLFPFGLLGMMFSREIEVPFVLIAIIQYPVYGLLLDLIGARVSIKWTAVSIASFHILLAIVILLFRESNWR